MPSPKPTQVPGGIADRLRRSPSLLTVQQVAEALGFNKMTIYDWVTKGKLPHVRVGSRIKFDGAAIADWLEKRTL
jgi:excisionase family DNA binding protein